MLKATLRGAVLLGCIWALATPSFAEVQNVRVGGDVTVRAFHRQCMDLNCGDDNLGSSATVSNVLEGTDDFLMQTTALNVGADLTENVSAFVRIVNERDWDSSHGTAGSAAGNVGLSQAYVTLKELFYSPVTLRVGTQPIQWGRGFVLGSNLLPGTLLHGDDVNSSITANEFTDYTAFDAIRASVDLSNVGSLGIPLSADFVYIKLDENTSTLPDDTNVMGANLGARFEGVGELETYFLNKRDKVGPSTLNKNGKDGSVNTVGIRGSATPMEGANLYSELAYQFGRRNLDLESILPTGDAAQGWAFNLGGDITLKDVALSPKFGAEWRFYSGHNVDGPVSGWEAIAPGYFTTALREFQTRSTITGFYPNAQTGVTSSQTNQHELALYGGLNPLEDLRINQRLSWFFLPVGSLHPVTGLAASNAKRESFLGAEWDTMVTYNYTDDVQLGLIYGVFFPGSVYRTGSAGAGFGNDAAQEIVTTVGVKF